MNAKEYLLQIRKLDRQIDDKVSMLKSLYDCVTSVTSVMQDTPVKGSGAGDKIGNTVAKIVDLQAEVNADVDRYVDLKCEAMARINKLDPPYSCILYKRYFEYKSWEQIAVELNFSFRHVTRMHGVALKKMS